MHEIVAPVSIAAVVLVPLTDQGKLTTVSEKYVQSYFTYPCTGAYDPWCPTLSLFYAAFVHHPQIHRTTLPLLTHAILLVIIP